MVGHDSVDLAIQEFSRAFPEVDSRPVAVTARIRRVNFYLDRNAELVFKSFGTTGASYDVLAALYAGGRPYALTPTELYRGRMMSSAGVTARLDAVERDGLAARSRDPHDRRGVIVSLTKKGEKLVRDAAVALHRRQSFILTLYSQRERGELLLLLKRLFARGESTAAAFPPTFDAVLGPWLREFPKSDPWLIEFLLVLPLLTIRINRESETLLARHDLSQTAMFILAALRRSAQRQRLAPRELARAVLLSPAGLTTQLDQLEKRALIERSPNASDRRAVHVALTRSGEKLVDEAAVSYLQAHERMLAPLPSAGRQALARLLRRLLAALEQNARETGRSDSIRERRRGPAGRSHTDRRPGRYQSR
ncbi:MAG TPA: MarR family transcriptional regulator [Candidatus Dormibacteraeota bacterium]|nr:MarR family transcriptional regulator [Candidatus Dormibacteraeota bacterium]